MIDLKVEAFKPEFAGKMNFYLSAVDDLLRHPDDKPSVGLIICKTKDRIVAEYGFQKYGYAHRHFRIQVGGKAASRLEGESADYRRTRERVRQDLGDEE